jgi:hypothetical protein
MTYTWSGFRIVCLGEKSAAQSVEEPDFQNAAARYNETDIFPCFVMRLARNAFQKEGILVAYGVFSCLKDEQLTTCLRSSTAKRSAWN